MSSADTYVEVIFAVEPGICLAAVGGCCSKDLCRNLALYAETLRLDWVRNGLPRAQEALPSGPTGDTISGGAVTDKGVLLEGNMILSCQSPQLRLLHLLLGSPQSHKKA